MDPFLVYNYSVEHTTQLIMALSAEHIISSLKSQYGSSVTSAEVRAWCAMNDVSYPTRS